MGPPGDVAVLGGIADGIAHVRDPALVDEVHDELELVEALEVCHLGRVARLDQRFEPGLDQCCCAAAQNGLLAEEVGLGLFLEGGLEDTCLAPADGASIRQRQVLGVSFRIRFDCDEHGHAPALGIFVAHHVAGGLGRHHEAAHALGRPDLAVVDVEPVGEDEILALFQMGLDLCRIDSRLELIRKEDHDHVGPFGGLGGGHDLEPGTLPPLPWKRFLRAGPRLPLPRIP